MGGGDEASFVLKTIENHPGSVDHIRVGEMFQTTLFGSRMNKTSFFSNLGHVVGPYYAVIEALWKLDPSDNRKSFLEKAQKLWKETYE